MGNDEAQAIKIIAAVTKIKTIVFACVTALICGVMLFVMTAWLVLKGGADVGAHLKLLSHYFPGYTITWGGSFVGFFYAALIGIVGGGFVGAVYNRIVHLRHRHS